jgi:hypothetical protein
MHDAIDDGATGRLLILDDDEAVGKTIGLCAQRAGLQTQAVGNVDAFLRLLDS